MPAASATILVAIELSQRNWLVVIHSPDRDRLSCHRLEDGDHRILLAPSRLTPPEAL